MKLKLSLVLLLIAFPTMLGFAQPAGIERATDLWRLPNQELGTFSFGDSSNDPSGLNQDGFIGLHSRIYYEDGKNVLFDAQGPGCVYRMWFTLLHPLSELEFYFDNETTPSLTIGQVEMFQGTVPPFENPLVWDQHDSSGGFACYVPICYEERLKIATERNIFFYNFNATKYPAETEVDNFSGGEDYTTANQVYDPQNADQDPKDTSDVNYHSDSFALPSKKSAAIFENEGPGQIASIIITPDLMDGVLLNDVHLTATFDWASEPQVDAQLGMFFGATVAGAEVRSLMIGITEGKLYCFYPMPYFEKVTISLRNDSDDELNFDTEVGYTDSPPDNLAGYFETAYRLTSPPITGRDLQLANPTGQGKIVGTVQISGGYSGQVYLEGDERYYPDGLLTPTIQGTGTEDYYNGGWYFSKGDFTLPTHGSPFHIAQKGIDITGMYRIHIGDVMHFHDGATFSIEHDAMNTLVDEVHRTLVFMYRIDEPALVAEGELDIGNPESETEFDYAGVGDVFVEKQPYFYEGDNDLEMILDDGYQTHHFAQFYVNVNPSNDGVRIVRRRDQSNGFEKVQVTVNGQDAGIWISPHQNSYKRWRDSVFEIPASISKGQHTLKIRIENLIPGRPFTHFRYWFYSWKKPVLSRLVELRLSADEYELNVGQCTDVKTKGFYQSGYSDDVTGWVDYELSDTYVAEIRDGQLCGLKGGKVMVRAYYEDLFSSEKEFTIRKAQNNDDDDDDDDFEDEEDLWPCCKITAGSDCCGC